MSVVSTIKNAITSGIEVVNSFIAVKITAVIAYIDTVFAKNVYAEDKVCVGSTCVTEDQLKTLLNNANTNQGSVNLPVASGTTSEQITGNNTTISSTPLLS
jgi:hypothetical protein